MPRPTYEEFVEKFKAKKTTDDCYTPEKVYNAIRDWVAEEYHVDADKFVRPFYPGGDYEHFDYVPDCVVVDNPPFSILSQIVKFYLYYNIKFFIFAPYKTLFNYGYLDVCLIGAGTDIIYENGAKVSTSFITNLEAPGVRSAPKLYRMVEAAIREIKKEDTKQLPKYKYPPEVLTFYTIEKLGHCNIDIKFTKEDLHFVRGLDSQREYGKNIYGAGFLLSKEATLKRLHAELEALTHEKGNDGLSTMEWTLSDREREIIAGMSKHEEPEVCSA